MPFNIQLAFESIHERINEVAETVHRRINEIDTKVSRTDAEMHQLVGNGQPGRIANVEKDVKELQMYVAKRKGESELTKKQIVLMGLIGSGLGFLIQIAVTLILRK